MCGLLLHPRPTPFGAQNFHPRRRMEGPNLISAARDNDGKSWGGDRETIFMGHIFRHQTYEAVKVMAK